jgi:hypothetical protein
MYRFAHFAAAIVVSAIIAFAFTSTAAFTVPIPTARPFTAPAEPVPFALAQLAPTSPPFHVAPSPQPAQTAAPTSPPVPVATSNSSGTTVETTGNVKSNTQISVGSFMGDILDAVLALFTGVLGTAITALVVKLLAGVGANITANRQAQLQALVERGLVLAASQAKKTLDGKIVFDAKDDVLANTLRYVETHGVDLIKSLGEQPGSPKTTQAVMARAESALADPAVPVQVAPAPARVSATGSDIRDIVKEQLTGLINEMKAAAAPKAV